MFRHGFVERILAACLLLVMLTHVGAGLTPAVAGDDALRSSCWAAASRADDVGVPAMWVCGDNEFSIDPERVLLRFDLAGAGSLPRYFLSRRSALEAVHLLAIDEDGTVRQHSLAASELASATLGGYFQAPLPEVTPATRQVIVAIDLPSHRMTLERAFLAPAATGVADGQMGFLLLLAGLTGMLAMPLIFNAAFYRILREPFVLWHSALTVALMLTIIVSSGLAVVMFNPPAMLLSWLTTLIFGLTVAAGMMFTHSFIEPGMMHRWLRRLLPFCAALAVGLSAFHAAFPFVGREVQSSIYTAAFSPVIIVFGLAILDAVRRGSRAARFQLIGYAPMVAVGLIRLVTGIVPWLHSTDAMLMFYLGCVWEVLFTTLGVAERFVTLKRERDDARSEAGAMELLSETDPLTGLGNRRAMEREFRQLQAQGYGALAILDLDHFKAINDVHGHAAGDAVLKAVAEALQGTPGMRAYRLGGEEFMVLLHGEHAELQAERCRQQITATVARNVPSLQRPVTASMGLTHCAGEEALGRVYERADKLLYEAKRGGRNRMRCSLALLPEFSAGAA